MGLREDIPVLVELVKANRSYLAHNAALFDIYEGNLRPYIERDLRAQLGEQSYKQILHRIPPVNLLGRVVDKLSKIYAQPPARMVKSRRKKADGELLQWYADSMKLNRVLNQGNEFFNLFKTCLLQPLVVRGKPTLRAIPLDRFVVRSTDPNDPCKASQVVLIAGTKKDTTTGEEVEIYYGYSDEEAIVFNSKGEMGMAMMAALENPEGENRYGKLPFVYVNRSPNRLLPTQDTDILSMVKLFPVLLADLSYAIMFQSFSIMYGIDLDDENLKMAPSAFWRFKSDPQSEKSPQIGTIKPQVDITEVLGYIQSLLTFWLQTRNIRPGAVGQLTAENFASGVSKMVDEMGTSEDRQRQVEYFRPAEVEDLWPLVMDHMHPYWVTNGLIENTAMFSVGASVDVNFAEQLPLVRRGEMVKDLKEEVDAGFLTRRDAIAKLNPHWGDDEVDAYAAGLEAERTLKVPEETEESEKSEDDEEAA